MYMNTIYASQKRLRSDMKDDISKHVAELCALSEEGGLKIFSNTMREHFNDVSIYHKSAFKAKIDLPGSAYVASYDTQTQTNFKDELPRHVISSNDLADKV